MDRSEPGFFIYNENASYDDAISSGIRFAVAHGAGVINMSLGTGSDTRSLRTAVGYAISHNIVVVASAGNSRTAGSGFTPYSYPAAYAGVISVGAEWIAGEASGRMST